MRVFLDDIRPIPQGFTHLARNYAEAVALLATREVTFISLDHDLGEDDKAGTGYDVACYIEEEVLAGKIPAPGWEVHSSNPVGRGRIIQALSHLR